MINVFNIWLKVVRKTINPKFTLRFLVEYLFIFAVAYYFSNYNLFITFVLLLAIIIIRSSVRIMLFYNELTRSGSYDLILLKPTNPLITLIIYSKNPTDILLLLLVLAYLKLRDIKN